VGFASPASSSGRWFCTAAANLCAVEAASDSGQESAALRPAVVAIVGRPNVGKSALFNRLIGRRLAIVEDTAGVTRDRLYAVCDWRGRTFGLVDTAGIDPQGESVHGDALAVAARAQAEAAASEADVVVFVVDAMAGLHPLDTEVAAILRRGRRHVVLAANKVIKRGIECCSDRPAQARQEEY